MKTNAALAAVLTGLTALSGPVALAAPPTTTSCSEERLTWLEKRVTMIGSTTVVLPPARCASPDVAVTRISARPSTGSAGDAGRHARIPERP